MSRRANGRGVVEPSGSCCEEAFSYQRRRAAKATEYDEKVRGSVALKELLSYVDA
jgi:hypothetical protein